MTELSTFLAELLNDPLRLTVVVLSGSVVVLLVLAILTWLGRGQEIVDLRLRSLSGEEPWKGDKNQEADAGEFDVRWIAPIGKLVLPKAGWQHSRLKKKLVLGGYLGSHALPVFLGIKLLSAATAALMLVLAAPFITEQIKQIGTTYTMILLVLITLIAFYLPDGILDRRIDNRQLAFSEGFPDAMDMLMVCIEAGMGLDAAINRVGDEVSFSHPRLGEEFQLLGLELRAGKDRDSALRGMAERTGVEVVQSLVTVLLQAEHFGTSIATTLRDFSDEMRTKRIQIAQEKAAKLPVKLIMPVLLFIFPALFMVIFAPAVVKIYRVLVIGGE